ncbi:MAG: M28 family peptidase [Planctomycetota bacterium]
MTKRAEFERLKAFILLDMVGDKQLGLTIEENSTPALYRLFREAADQAGLGKHWSRHSQRLSDDHLPFLALGIPSIDLIDFEYGPDNEYWHSPEDTLEHCSQESLQANGDIVRAGLVALEKKLALMLVALPAACRCCRNRSRPPNIVLILADDLGASEVGRYA